QPSLGRSSGSLEQLSVRRSTCRFVQSGLVRTHLPAFPNWRHGAMAGARAAVRRNGPRGPQQPSCSPAQTSKGATRINLANSRLDGADLRTDKAALT
nr:hypothetical protein [Tanacetum cinerariifolium]